MTTRIRTLGDLIDADYWLMVCCDNLTPPCQHAAPLSIDDLVERYGRNMGCDHWSLARLPWRCSRCGSRQVSFRLSARQRMAPSFGYIMPERSP